MEYQFIYPFLFDQSSRCNRPQSYTNNCQRKQDSTTKSTWTPRIDIGETETSFILRAELPGVKKEDINLNIEKDTLTISGEKKSVVFEKVEQPSTSPSSTAPSSKDSDNDIELPRVEEDFEDLSAPSTTTTKPTSTTTKDVVASTKDDSNNNNTTTSSTSPTIQYHRREINYGKFSRSFELTDDLEVELITAKHNDGVLEITIPKKKQLPPKQFKVNIN